jgi:hypothetical protein
MPPGDDLIIIFLLSSAFLAGLEAMKATGWRIWAFGVLSGAFVCAGLGWHWLKDVYPPFTGWMSAIVNNPESWFILLALGLVWLATTGRRRKKPFEPDGNRDEITDSLLELVRKVAFLQGQFDLLPTPAPYDDGKLLSALSEVNETAKNAQSKSKELDAVLSTYMGDIEKTIRQIQETLGQTNKNLMSNNQRIVGYDRDIPVMMEIMMEHLALSILFNALPALPSFTPDITDLDATKMVVERKSAETYSGEVRSVLGDTQWGMHVRSIIASAEGDGEHVLRNIPEHERPAIDTLDLRLYIIARTRCFMLHAFIQAQRREAASKYVGHLDFMRRRREERRILDGNPN